ncbi:MAG TPA: archaeosortase/exosortase family protein [Polyangiaceae bacterium]|nr:archaeosortase/exosortase family protein [Polyangiaceae bacterium]
MQQRAPNVGWRFLFRAIVLMCAFYALVHYPHEPDSALQRVLNAESRLQAHAAGFLVRLFDSRASVQGTVIHGRFPLQVIKGCTSMDVQALFAGTILAFPAGWAPRLLGVVAGGSALILINIVRIASLYFVGAHLHDSFDFVHEELFPLVLVVAACGCLLAWFAWTGRTPRDRAAAALARE